MVSCKLDGFLVTAIAYTSFLTRPSMIQRPSLGWYGGGPSKLVHCRFHHTAWYFHLGEFELNLFVRLRCYVLRGICQPLANLQAIHGGFKVIAHRFVGLLDSGTSLGKGLSFYLRSFSHYGRLTEGHLRLQVTRSLHVADQRSERSVGDTLRLDDLYMPQQCSPVRRARESMLVGRTTWMGGN
eukprot:TRINITY_DN49677_c0_g1_i1.p1 TRINITY_DN49677_c0_g1~~TRINITY_DN49677_c0_g1_i1.p1  ORF type:complete len:183 (+),score=14.15 TRINITY_DN49677_c0_g1_i1:185-733(+)